MVFITGTCGSFEVPVERIAPCGRLETNKISKNLFISKFIEKTCRNTMNFKNKETEFFLAFTDRVSTTGFHIPCKSH